MKRRQFMQQAAALAAVKKYGLRLVGLHMHIGSGVDYGHLASVCDAMVGLVDHVRTLGHDIQAISAGGGLSIPYRQGESRLDTAHYFSLWDAARTRIAELVGHAVKLEIDPHVAFLSFSNFGSTPHPLSDKVRKAVALVKARRPDLRVDGEMQADTAVVPEIAEERYPFSAVKDANVLVFPSLESANIAYKLLARLGNAKAIGPILLGVGAPVHVLQTGDDVNAIVQIASVAVMDAMGR